jgi:hypothetical protein
MTDHCDLNENTSSPMLRRAVLMLCLGCAIAWAALLIASIAEAQGVRPDFHLLLEKCKTTVGYQVLSEESLKIFEGEPIYNACTRKSRKVSCVLGSEGIKGKTADYSVVLDSPPHLHFTDDTYADYFAVNLSNHTVVLVTRVLFDKGLGSKCLRPTMR